MPASRAPLSRSHAGALAVVVAIACAVGWRFRWILDDAYISFRYAENWVNGHGLVFNPGESPPVEGYTNFLWTLVNALPIAFGLDPTVPTLAFGVAVGAATLLATFALSRRALATPELALLATALVAANYTFLCFMTSGLETMLQCGLTTACFAIALDLDERAPSARALLALSLCGALALLTRLDTAVLGAVLFAWIAIRLRGAERPARALLLLLGPAALMLGAWLAWKLSFYGELLPNTWYARESGVGVATRALRGLSYLGDFALDYYAAPFVALLFVPRALRGSPQRLFVCAIALWCCYVVYAGADYMEYRFLVPVIPLFVIALVRACASLHRALPLALAAALFAGSAVHGVRNDGTPLGEGPHAPVDRSAPEEPWRTHFEAVRRTVESYPGSERWRWTLPALGMAGYYTRFHVVDMHGLVDREIAREGRVADISPAHDKYASLATLRARGVTFAHSFQDPCHYRQYYGREFDGAEVFLVVFDVDATHHTSMLLAYLTRDPVADRMLAERGQRVALPSAEQCAAARRERGERWIGPDEAARESR